MCWEKNEGMKTNILNWQIEDFIQLTSELFRPPKERSEIAIMKANFLRGDGV